jgi:translation initiation factor IF-3
MPAEEALGHAQRAGLDLVEVAAQADPPVCRLMDYGKWKYEQDVRAREARKRQAHVVVKEMKYRPKISPHDYEVKTKMVERFLRSGFKVKVTIMFRGREMAHPELGAKLLDRIADDLKEIASVEARPKSDERNIVMLMSPLRRAGAKPTKQAQAPQAASGS